MFEQFKAEHFPGWSHHVLKNSMAQNDAEPERAREYVVEYECPMCQLNWTCVVENVVLAAECPRCGTGNIEPLDSFTLEL